MSIIIMTRMDTNCAKITKNLLISLRILIMILENFPNKIFIDDRRITGYKF